MRHTETLFVATFAGALCEERDLVEGDEAGILPRPRLVPGLRQVRSPGPGRAAAPSSAPAGNCSVARARAPAFPERRSLGVVFTDCSCFLA